MMKILSLLFFVFLIPPSFANLYLQTEYREGNKPKIVTKQHIFLEKRYNIYYTKKKYVLILKKINPTEATIESESYDVDKKGHLTMHGGSYGTYKIGKSFTLTDLGPNGDLLYSLKITLEKYVDTKP